MWGETIFGISSHVRPSRFQPTLPVWGETSSGLAHGPHFPLFQPTLPVWGETPYCTPCCPVFTFQPTLPVWGETGLRGISLKDQYHFNPLSPCGERPAGCVYLVQPDQISTHSPRVGRDWYQQKYNPAFRNFNPLSPCGERLKLLQHL